MKRKPVPKFKSKRELTDDQWLVIVLAAGTTAMSILVILMSLTEM